MIHFKNGLHIACWHDVEKIVKKPIAGNIDYWIATPTVEEKVVETKRPACNRRRNSRWSWINMGYVVKWAIEQFCCKCDKKRNRYINR